jgi:hypothetical protein
MLIRIKNDNSNGCTASALETFETLLQVLQEILYKDFNGNTMYVWNTLCIAWPYPSFLRMKNVINCF